MATAGEVLRRSLPKEIGVCNGSSTRGSEELHVLAVDDSLVDRKVIERLLRISSCKGTCFVFLKVSLLFFTLIGLFGVRFDMVLKWVGIRYLQ